MLCVRSKIVEKQTANSIFQETCIQMEAELLDFGGEDDHVHIMVCCPPKLSLSNLVGKLKGKSSYFLRQEYWPEIKNKFWGAHFWSPSYCAVSAGGAPLNIIKKYIENQRNRIYEFCDYLFLFDREIKAVPAKGKKGAKKR